ncbi:MAG: zinc ribbon domain-containing protein [Vulcanisaeta sp.]|jgi:putative transposase|nr:zinc ribbon domain-containing protein [Vulcanisaeta sp.]
MKAHRAILVELPRDKCDVEYIKRLIALTNLAYRDFEVLAPDLPKNIQYQLYGFKSYKNSLVFGTVPKRWFARTWIPLTTLRIYSDGSMKGNRSALVVLDFRSNVIRLRQVCKNEPRYVVELPMPKWVIERMNEGGDVRYAMIGVKDNEPYLALVAEREAEPYQPSNCMLVVDVNAWNNGVAWGLIKDGSIIRWKPERPRLSEIEGLYNLSVRLSKKYGKLKRLELGKTEEGERLRREIKRVRRKLYAKLRDYVQKLVHRLVRKALRHKALVIIDNMTEESRKELLEEKIPSGLRKLYLMYTRRFVKLLITQLKWYGVPYEFKKLPSTVCPFCEHELTQLPGRTMACPNCGFKAPRDKVPIYWALRGIQLRKGVM